MTFPIRIGVQLQPQHSPHYGHLRDAVRRCEDIVGEILTLSDSVIQATEALQAHLWLAQA